MKEKSKEACLKEIYAYQEDFDKRHGWFWEVRSKDDFISHLLYLGVALAGEVGEFCNEIKKVARTYKSNGSIQDSMVEKLKEELVDVFVYVVKGASQLLQIDLVTEYFRKMKKNEERFKQYEK